MKKIICAICGISLLTSAALAETTSVTVELNTPIKWYEIAVRESLANIVGYSEESSESLKYLERQKKQ